MARKLAHGSPPCPTDLMGTELLAEEFCDSLQL